MTPAVRYRTSPWVECRKEFVLKTISRLSRAWVVAGLVLLTDAAQVEGGGTAAVWIAAWSIAQAGGEEITSEDRRAATVELLEAARQSMKAGNWESADSQLTRAEELEASFGLLHFGDTPKKVRQDYERLRAKSESPRRGLQRLLPFNRSQDKPDAEDENPFAGREPAVESQRPQRVQPRAGAPDSPLTADTGRVRATPPTTRANPLETRRPLPSNSAQQNPTVADRAAGPRGVPVDLAPRTSGLRTMGDAAAVFDEPAPQQQTSAPQSARRQVPPRSAVAAARPAKVSSPKLQSDQLLLDARRALARGDVRRARSRVDQALALRVQYTLSDDTPQKIAAAIQHHVAIAENRAEMGNSQSFRREQAIFLMEQAEALLHWNDFDEAERLVQDVVGLRVELGPFDAQPAGLLERIAAARRAPTSRAPSEAAIAGRGNPAGPEEAVSLAKTRATELLGTARAALDVGDLRQAERLARQAEALRVPDQMFAGGEDRPNAILVEIERRKGNDVRLAGGDRQDGPDEGVGRALYNPRTDASRNVTIGAEESDTVDFPPSTAAAQPDESTMPDTYGEPAIISPRLAAVPDNGAAAAKPLKNTNPDAIAADTQQALGLIERGETALGQGDQNTALLYFRQAAVFNDVLPPDMRERLGGHLAQLGGDATGQPATLPEGAGAPITLTASDETQRLPPVSELPPGEIGSSPYPPSSAGDLPTANYGESIEPPAALPDSLLGKATAEQQVATRQLQQQISRRLAEARNLRESDDPKQSIEILNELRATVEKSDLDAAVKQQYLLRIDRSLSDTQKYLEANRLQLEFKEQSAATKAQIDREQQLHVEVDNRVAMLVEEYNQLMDQRRFAEADVIARKADEIAHDNPVVQQLLVSSRLMRNVANSLDLRSAKEQGFVDALDSVERSSTPFDDSKPYQFPSIREWEKLANRRRSFPADQPVRNEREIEIQKKLKTPVSLQFEDAPLSQVLELPG